MQSTDFFSKMLEVNAKRLFSASLVALNKWTMPARTVEFPV